MIFSATGLVTEADPTRMCLARPSIWEQRDGRNGTHASKQASNQASKSKQAASGHIVTAKLARPVMPNPACLFL